ncbi:MAG: pseudouridine synthase [Flavobacteriia bacterium]|nr:pseudouridine synthase [Flavobacteriia bacterium]
MNQKIIFEDKYCFCVNKPNNLLVHHSHFARNIEEDSLVQILKQHGFETPIPIHRLDRKTSGLILFSKSKEYVKKFQELFDNESIKKKYIALVRGYVLEKMILNSPVKNEKGNYKDALSELIPIKTIEINIPVQPYNTARYSYIEFYPKTGRTHQLRIHANKISHPIIGDHKHGNRHHNHMFQEVLNLHNLFLHAEELTFMHPLTNENIHLTAPKPDFWNEFEALSLKYKTC